MTAIGAGATVAELPARRPRGSPQRKVGLALKPRELALRCVELAQSKKAEDVVLIDLREVTNFTQFFVVATATSDAQLRAVADSIVDGLAAAKHKVWHTEGSGRQSWMLLDYVDVVVHVFLPEARAYYALERLWNAAPIQTFQD